MSQLYKDAVFWIETENIVPNPYQPRKKFNEDSLEDLADSIRQYGILQPLVVTRNENMLPEGGMEVTYELIAGERRLRGAKLAGLHQVPVIIRKGDDNKLKLELAIIENLQREDLNPMDRAEAFMQLAEEFSLTHAQIGKKMGKSREYVSNSVRLLALPDYIKEAVRGRDVSEGHTRPLLMLNTRPDEQRTLFKEIMYKKMTVRESEKIARNIAKEKQRKRTKPVDRTLTSLQRRFEEALGTRVSIEKNRGKGGKLVIDYFTQEDLDALLVAMKESSVKPHMKMEEEENTPVSLGATKEELDKMDNIIEEPFRPKQKEVYMSHTVQNHEPTQEIMQKKEDVPAPEVFEAPKEVTTPQYTPKAPPEIVPAQNHVTPEPTARDILSPKKLEAHPFERVFQKKNQHAIRDTSSHFQRNKGKRDEEILLNFTV
jgi:ParB family chromosome partitioning protein